MSIVHTCNGPNDILMFNMLCVIAPDVTQSTWVAEMYKKHGAEAKAKGVRIVSMW